MNTRYLNGFILEPKTTLSSSEWVMQTWDDLPTFFLAVADPWKRYNPMPENGTISPRIVTPLLTTCTVLHALTMHFCRRVVELPPCCLQIRSAWLWLVRGNLTNQWRAHVLRPFVPFRLLSGVSGKFSRQGVENTPYWFPWRKYCWQGPCILL